MTPSLDNRRPLRSRDAGWARGAATALARAGISPNRVSRAAVIFGIAGGALLAVSGVLSGGPRVSALLGGALCMQLRLVCNLLDGMVAVEHGRGGPAGPIWNEVPDRIADAAFCVGAGYGASLAGVGWGEAAGWAAAVAAVFTAYVRELGRGLGQPADFGGPMAKPHRMALLTAAAVIAAAEPLWAWRGQTLAIALAFIAIGAVLTAALRLGRLAARLKRGPS